MATGVVQFDQQHVKEKLKKGLAPEVLALLDLITLHAAPRMRGVYVVGGLVRDVLLGHKTNDLDVVFEGDAIAIGKLMVAQFGGELEKHNRFGTAKWLIADIKTKLVNQLGLPRSRAKPDALPDFVDLITARAEAYEQPATLPVVAFSTIREDLRRRDFSINTLAIRLDGPAANTLIDQLDGLADLENRSIRVLHRKSFIDDPTRIFRAIRFEQRLDFTLEPETFDWLGKALLYLVDLTGARIRHEFELIFDEAKVDKIMQRLDELNILFALHPALKWQAVESQCWEKLKRELKKDDLFTAELGAKEQLLPALAYMTWLADLPEHSIIELVQRMKLKNDIKALLLSVKYLFNLAPKLPGASPSEITFALDNASPLGLFFVWATSSDRVLRKTLSQYMSVWRKMKPVTDGDKLRKLGLPEGPQYRSILTTLRAAWLDGTIKSAQAESLLLSKLLADRAH